MNNQGMKVLSLVPSLTETLVECGVNVVGRTRFCIHPGKQVKNIPVVGGTKDVDWNKVKFLRPDIVIFDKEENTKSMADSCPYQYHATHFQSIQNVAQELEGLAKKLNTNRLDGCISQWRQLSPQIKTPQNLPGVIQWLEPLQPTTQIEKIIYLIWKDPWMAAGRDTFIHSVFESIGLGSLFISHEKKYPQVNLERFDPKTTLFLFSSEPYPFVKKQKELADLPGAKALVDGECFSWFGLRSLRFLQSIEK